jgi:hypothetical protein
MTAYAERASRAISRATVEVSSRSHPSEQMSTTAPLESEWRPHLSLNAFNEAPIFVPPDQSSTRRDASSSARSASRPDSSSVRRVSLVPKAKASTPRPLRSSAWTKISNARE